MISNMSNKIMNFNSSLKIMVTLIVVNMIYYVQLNHEKTPGLIYILQWTDGRREPFALWSTEQKSLITNNCTFKNCFIVKDRGYFEDVLDYDVILFTPITLGDYDLPMARSDNQLYVFTCVEPAAYLSLDGNWNFFFNHTWTYRLDSDLTYPFFFVTNRHGKRVGPQINAHWRDTNGMKSTGENVIDKLKDKTTAAAWFVTRCIAMNSRAAYGHDLKEALKKYNLSIDIYGPCGNLNCPKYNSTHCHYLVEKYYYFYLAFENSNCEDYVTEKLMTALKHYAVPVVLGGANYSSFMPDGIYLDANILTEVEVAEAMNEAIQDKRKYYDYFRWHRYYTYHSAEGGDTDPLCQFCAYLNDESVRNKRRVYAHFDKWWNEYRTQRGTEDLIVNYEESAPYIRSVVTYRESKVNAIQTIESPSVLDNINNLFGDIFNYFFPQLD